MQSNAKLSEIAALIRSHAQPDSLAEASVFEPPPADQRSGPSRTKTPRETRAAALWSALDALLDRARAAGQGHRERPETARSLCSKLRAEFVRSGEPDPQFIVKACRPLIERIASVISPKEFDDSALIAALACHTAAELSLFKERGCSDAVIEKAIGRLSVFELDALLASYPQGIALQSLGAVNPAAAAQELYAECAAGRLNKPPPSPPEPCQAPQLEDAFKIESGEFDDVHLVSYRGQSAVLKRFRREDPFARERYFREKFLFVELAGRALAPGLLAYDDAKMLLVTEYFNHVKARDKAALFDMIPAIMTASRRLHRLEFEIRPSILQVSSLGNGPARAEALEEALRQSVLSRRIIRRYFASLKALVKHAASSSFNGADFSLLHGDLHPPNALKAPWSGDVRFIDFGRSRLGDAAFDIAYFTYRTTNGNHWSFSWPEICDWFHGSLSSYGGADQGLIERASMYYHFWLVFDLCWLTKEWARFNPQAAISGQRIAGLNLAKVAEAWPRGFTLAPVIR